MRVLVLLNVRFVRFDPYIEVSQWIAFGGIIVS
jgi:hypothetical protein